jgi:hypothetical protein
MNYLRIKMYLSSVKVVPCAEFEYYYNCGPILDGKACSHPGTQSNILIAFYNSHVPPTVSDNNSIRFVPIGDSVRISVMDTAVHLTIPVYLPNEDNYICECAGYTNKEMDEGRQINLAKIVKEINRQLKSSGNEENMDWTSGLFSK